MTFPQLQPTAKLVAVMGTERANRMMIILIAFGFLMVQKGNGTERHNPDKVGFLQGRVK